MRVSNYFDEAYSYYDEVLASYRDYWQISPFTARSWPWQESTEQLQKTIGEALQALPNIIDTAVSGEEFAVPFWLAKGIPGRKLEQLQGFVQHIDGDFPLIEWCAGKGHLGRLSSFRTQQSVLSLEWQAGLCQQGEQLAEHQRVAQQFLAVDVMQLPFDWLPSERSVVALHACGDLHRRLLEQAATQGQRKLFIAPCCYHLIKNQHYQPLSKRGQQSLITLSRAQLKLAVQEQVTGGNRVARLRDIEQLWRLLFETYRAECTGQTSYRPLPSVAKHWFSGPLMAFIAWACKQQQLALPTLAQLDALLPRAQQRLQLVREIDTVRQLFRLPLERWLQLDYVLYLQQQGYQVQLRQFCRYQDSPRNTLIIAKR